MVHKDPDARRAYHRQWRSDNPEKVARYTRKWRQANPEKVTRASAAVAYLEGFQSSPCGFDVDVPDERCSPNETVPPTGFTAPYKRRLNERALSLVGPVGGTS